MKSLILYASKYGCTEDCAKNLKSQLNHESTIVDIKDIGKLDLQQYDWIIIGSSIYIGKIRKEVRFFCEHNLELLLKKNIMLFICCTTPDQVDDFFKSNFPVQLVEHSIKNMNFGGELRQHRMGFVDRVLTRMVSKVEQKQVGMLQSNIDIVVDTLNIADN